MKNDLRCVEKAGAGYPGMVEACLGAEAPGRLDLLGEPGLLEGRKTAIFCSGHCPGAVVLDTYDLVRRMGELEEERTVIGGFHSPLEKHSLGVLLRTARPPVIVCPSRGLGGLRIPPDWRAAIESGRMLLLSPFPAEQRRGTQRDAQRRNLLVAALADEIVVAHAQSGGKIAKLLAVVEGWGKAVTLIEAGGEQIAGEEASRR